MKKVYQNNTGNTLVYAIILINLTIIVMYIIFSKAEVLISNIKIQNANSKLSRNIEEKANYAIKYDKYLNLDGSGFIDTKTCPTFVTMSGTISGGTLETIDTFSYFNGSKLYCSGSTMSGNLLLSYNSNYSSFSSGIYFNEIQLNGSSTLTGLFSDPEYKFISFNVPVIFSDLDGNFNSDNYTPYSTGNIKYPNNYQDNDSLARKTFYGYIRKNIGWYNIFWNNKDTNKYIQNNPNNIDDFNAKIGDTATGFIYLDVDNPFNIKVVEFDSGSWINTKELKKLSSQSTISSSGGLGYLQNDLSLSGSKIDGKVFNFRDKNYAIFLSFSGNLVSTGITNLQYKMTAENENGSGVYMVPLDDSSNDYIKYLGNDIIIDVDNNYLSKETEIIKQK